MNEVWNLSAKNSTYLWHTWSLSSDKIIKYIIYINLIALKFNRFKLQKTFSDKEQTHLRKTSEEEEKNPWYSRSVW